MLTSLPGVRVAVAKDDRPAYRPFAVRVVRAVRLSPHFTRVTFTGPELRWFGTDRLDQRVKLLFPAADGRLSDIGADDPEAVLAGTWYARWRELPEAERSPLRTYTVRDVRPTAREVDVDMVVHEDGGPAARWALRAAPGDELLLVGPDARSKDSGIGIDWAPGTATELLLAGDETAAPAICSILESLPAGRAAHAFIEVPGAEDVLPLTVPAGAEVTWLARGDRPRGEAVVAAVREWVAANPQTVRSGLAVTDQPLEDVDIDADILWDSPAARVLPVDLCARGAERCGDNFYAWFAGEASMIKTLRRRLVSDVGVCRRRVAFMGYWRLGRSEAQ